MTEDEFRNLPGTVAYDANGHFAASPVIARMSLSEFMAAYPNARGIGRNTLGEHDGYKYVFAAQDATGPGCHYLQISVAYELLK